ncbi:hypothetical protein ACTU6V_01715 [Microbacterium sp. A204]|uniref:hypothetical protein n=1 Tax=Microbacterium sp. A204 TaxID=3457321 RepID=UPI003FD60308
MSTIGVVQDLTGFFLSVGMVGAGVAVLCALIALTALAQGAAGVTGGAVAVWIGGALLSLTSGFSGQWLPAIIAGGSLVAALALGGVARVVLRSLQLRVKAVPVEASEAAATVTTIAQPARQLSVRTVTPESIR